MAADGGMCFGVAAMVGVEVIRASAVAISRVLRWCSRCKVLSC